MSSFKSFKRGQLPNSTPSYPNSSPLRPSRPLEPLPTSQQALPPTQEQADFTVRFQHSIEQIPVFPSEHQTATPPSSHPLVTGAVQRREGDSAREQNVLSRENNTGLADTLKAGIESLSGMSMDDVKVHYNSSNPAQVQALAYTQGTQIHVAPGQEKHLAHEAWHVAQQKQGRVKPTLRAKGAAINDDKGLEREADVMGEKANKEGHLHLQRKKLIGSELVKAPAFTGGPIQFRREIRFDASDYSVGLIPPYDPAETHFTYLEDDEIVGTAAQPWLAGPGENIHVTIQNTDHSIVAHYFYNSATMTWRFHGYGGAPSPYGIPPAANLQNLQNKAIEYFRPPANVVIKTGKKLSQRERKKLAKK